MISFEEVRSTGTEASARILGTGDGPFELWFRVQGAEPVLGAEALVSLALPVAMAAGQDVDLAGAPLDVAFAAGARSWQEVFAAWYPDRLQPVEVLGAKPARPARRRADGVGCFFTAGVDSFHSVLANRERLTHLVFVHGFDVPLEGRPELRAEVTERVRAAASELGLPLIEVETNLHDFSDTRQRRGARPITAPRSPRWPTSCRTRWGRW